METFIVQTFFTHLGQKKSLESQKMYSKIKIIVS